VQIDVVLVTHGFAVAWEHPSDPMPVHVMLIGPGTSVTLQIDAELQYVPDASMSLGSFGLWV
jgi:hypothetical protein